MPDTLPPAPTPRVYLHRSRDGALRLEAASPAKDILRPGTPLIDCHKIARTAVAALRASGDFGLCMSRDDQDTGAYLLRKMAESGGGAVTTKDGITRFTYAFVAVEGPEDDPRALIRDWMRAADAFGAEYDAEADGALGIINLERGA
ncbi:hypothetical protein PVW47_01530 [Marinovum sp. SP66]|uniref:hypothetical protein n=1 Tax=Marinovum TaxID=367771 RepID=UPI00237B112B|nr:hypothetical protein [Marinovum sp. SP66]MDD9738454.1 hypothetical protein [Marinovum sp. SP66]